MAVVEMAVKNEKNSCRAIFVFLSFYAYPAESGNNISLGICGIGFTSENETRGFYFSGYFINFSHQTSRGIGFNISPLHYYSSAKDPGVLFLTFVNTSLFYNFLKDKYFVLGIFGSLNAIAINYNRFDFIELYTGIKFSIHNIDLLGSGFYKDSIFGYDFLAIELGYKYNNEGRRGFYGFVGIDLLTALYHRAINKKDDFRKYQKDQIVCQGLLRSVI